MRRWAAAMAVAALGASASVGGAATYHVRPGGDDARSGLTLAEAWRSLARANAVVRAGDVVWVSDGDYAELPNPAHSGTPGARITFVGNLAHPGAVRCRGENLFFKASHVTWKGFQLESFWLEGSHDSIAWCETMSGFSRLIATDDCVLAHSRIRGSQFWVTGPEGDTLTKCERNAFHDNVFDLVNDGGGHTIRLAFLEANRFERNRFNLRIGPQARSGSPTKLFFVRRSRFADCRWDIDARCTGDCDEAGWFVLRDFTQHNLFRRDTLVFRGPGRTALLLSCSGSYPGTVMNNNWDRCVIRQDAPSDYGAAAYYQDACNSDTLVNNVIIGRDAALMMPGSLVGRVQIAANTFVARAPASGAVNLTPRSMPGRLELRRNIFYTSPRAARTLGSVALSSNLDVLRGRLVADENVYFCPLGRDSAILAYPAGPSRPGAGGAWALALGVDTRSTYGSPRFADTSGVLSFDVRLGAGSAARNAGRLAGATGPPFGDPVPPGDIADLAASDVRATSVLLTWTGTGADGARGTPAAYDLRVSREAITAENFDRAARLRPAPVVRASGQVHTYVVTDLAPGTAHWFAIRAVDAGDNRSRFTRAVSVVTPPQ